MLRTRRVPCWFRLVVAAALAPLIACAPGEVPSDAELYRLAIDRAQAELSLPDTVAVHPLLFLAGPPDPSGRSPRSFNAYDPESVPRILDTPGGVVLSRCRLEPSGACAVPEGEAAVLLGEIDRLGPTTVVIPLVVQDTRPNRPAHTEALVRIEIGRSGLRARVQTR